MGSCYYLALILVFISLVLFHFRLVIFDCTLLFTKEIVSVKVLVKILRPKMTFLSFRDF